MQVWIELLWQIAPPLLAAFYPRSPLTPIVIAAIEAAERAGGSGAEKKATALQHIETSARVMSDTAVNGAIGPTAVRTTAAPIIDAVVSTINAWTSAERAGAVL